MTVKMSSPVASSKVVPVDRCEQWVARQMRQIDAANTTAASDRARFRVPELIIGALVQTRG